MNFLFPCAQTLTVLELNIERIQDEERKMNNLLEIPT